MIVRITDVRPCDLGFRVSYVRPDTGAAAALIIPPDGTVPGAERLRRGAVVEISRQGGQLEIREPPPSMRVIAVGALLCA